VGSIPTLSRQLPHAHHVIRRRLFNLARTACRAIVVVTGVGLLLIALSARASAQRADSGTVAVKPVSKTATRKVGDSTVARPPISPRRAFLSSLLVPGLGQAKLNRGNSGALYFTVEAMSLGMIAKTKRDLHAAESFPDSVIVGYTPSDSGPKAIKEPTQLGLRVRSRKVQVEDWIAVLIFNHFFSGADAFVAAQLWDLPIVLSAEPSERGGRLAARVRW
jgi:hypothetical protein